MKTFDDETDEIIEAPEDAVSEADDSDEEFQDPDDPDFDAVFEQ